MDLIQMKMKRETAASSDDDCFGENSTNRAIDH